MAASNRVAERCAAWALLALAMAFVWFAAVEPIRRSFAGLRAEIEQTEALARRYETVLASAPSVETLEAALASSQAARTHVMAPSAELAAAELQERVRTAFAVGGLTAESMLVLTEPDAGWIGLRVQFRSDLPRFAHLLGALEGVAPVTVIERIAVSREPSAIESDEASWPQLGVSLDLRAAVRIGPPAAGSEP